MSKFSEWLDREMGNRGGRKYRGINLASDLGVREATVSEWLNDKKPPSPMNIQKIAVHFGTTSRHIYSLLGEPAPEGLNDDEEVMFGLIKRLERDGHADNFIRVLLEKASKGELSDATKAKIMAALEAGGQSDIHADHSEPMAAPKRKKA